MIRTLRLENYRSFKEYELRDLAKVNLLVGANNCGKTSVLEAVELLASRGDPTAVVAPMRRRSESHVTSGGRKLRYPVYHQFRGHRIGLGSRLSVSSAEGLGRVAIQIVEGWADESHDLFDLPTADLHPLALLIQRGKGHEHLKLPLREDGSLDWPPAALRHREGRPWRLKSLPIQFVTAESLRPREMADLWDQVLVAGRESEVVSAMRILQADLDSIHFLTGEGAGRTGGIVLGFQAGSPRAPIGSYGDGMRRLLALALSLVRSADGFLLIDEIDTGLHWTVMEEMWKLVVDAALASSIQVFATTHSLDCINGLAALLRARQDLAEVVSVQKIERQLDSSVSFDPEAIVTAADLSIEMR